MFKFLNNLVMATSCTLVIACSNANYPDGSQATNKAATNQTQSDIVGGWAPVFFTSMDKNQLDNIAAGLNTKRIKRANISYPTKMEPLAREIHDYLAQKTQLDIPLESVELKDTEQIKYNLTQVIVILYFN